MWIEKKSPIEFLLDLSKSAGEYFNNEKLTEIVKMCSVGVDMIHAYPRWIFKYFLRKSTAFEYLLYSLATQYAGKYEDVAFVVDRQGAKVYVATPTVFIGEAALLGLYNMTKIINPFAKMFIELATAMLYYNLFLKAIDILQKYLEEGKIEDAKYLINGIKEMFVENPYVKIPTVYDLVDSLILGHSSYEDYRKARKTSYIVMPLWLVLGLKNTELLDECIKMIKELRARIKVLPE